MSDELKRDYQEKLGDKFGAIVNGVSYDWANGLSRLQRCTEHKRADLLQHCPAHARRELRRDYNRIVYAKNGIDARKAYDELVAKWTPLAPAVVRSLEEAVISC